MIIEFKNKKQQTILGIFFGIIWVVTGVYKIFKPERFEWKNTWFLVLTVIYLIILFHRIKKQYITIENGVISKNTIFSKPMNLNDIKSIEKKSEKYILASEFRKFTINTKVIEEKSLNELIAELEKLNLTMV